MSQKTSAVCHAWNEGFRRVPLAACGRVLHPGVKSTDQKFEAQLRCGATRRRGCIPAAPSPHSTWRPCVRPPHAQASPWAYLLTPNAAAAAAISTSAPSSAPASTWHFCSFLPSYSLPFLGKKAPIRPKRFAKGPPPRTAKARTTLTVRCPPAPVDPRTQHPHPRPCLSRRLQLVSRLRYLRQRLGQGGVGRGRG